MVYYWVAFNCRYYSLIMLKWTFIHCEQITSFTKFAFHLTFLSLEFFRDTYCTSFNFLFDFISDMLEWTLSFSKLSTITSEFALYFRDWLTKIPFFSNRGVRWCWMIKHTSFFILTIISWSTNVMRKRALLTRYKISASSFEFTKLPFCASSHYLELL